MDTQKSAAELRRSGYRCAWVAASLFAAGLVLSLTGLAIPSAAWPLVICAWVFFIPAGYAMFRELRLFRAATRADR
jgi:hypothetical protein